MHVGWEKNETVFLLLLLFKDDMRVSVENLKEATKQLPELISNCIKVAGAGITSK